MAYDVTTVGIVDNDRFALRAMQGFLSKALPQGYVVSALWDDPRQAVSQCCRVGSPDVLLVDMSMEGMGGIEVIAAVRRRNERMALLAVTSFPLNAYAADAAEAGAQGIVSKDRPDMMAELVLLLAGGNVGEDCGGVRFPTVDEAYGRACLDGGVIGEVLSARECEAVSLCAEGLTSERIARCMAISEATVNTHLHRAAVKLKARNRAHLVSLWLRRVQV